MKFEHNGVEIELSFDDNGFPYVDINLRGYEGDNHRPTIEVSINGECIHQMFKEEKNKECIPWYWHEN